MQPIALSRPMNRRLQKLTAAATLPTIAGCTGAQSTLDPAGREAAQIAELFWWMVGGAIIIWLVMVVLAVYAIWVDPERHDPRRTARFIIGGGVVFPTVVLTTLLVFGLQLLPQLVAPAPEGSLQIEVNGLQWWWRVRYPGDETNEAAELANEIRLPVGEPVQFLLQSEDVIHAFWIPSLGGKIDMIPGRTTRLTLTPTRTGTFRGACAEYCGEAHAHMNFDVIVMERPEFDAWLEHQRQPVSKQDEPLLQKGRELFLSRGCGACHTVRGTNATGRTGPDLTHVGGRTSIAASVLPNEINDFHTWLTDTDDVKPGVLMPSFHMLPEDERGALAAWLEGLQ